jgi:Na+/melibiose symporter-like transporter
MCVNAEVSLSSFIIGVISSICLIYYGNKKFQKENLSVGIFFIYVSMIQLLEYFIWIDLDNKKGLNKIISIIFPVIICSQPVVFYIIKSIIFNKSVLWINLLIIYYILEAIFAYKSYLTNETLITKVKKFCV